MSTTPKEPEDFATLYRRAFQDFGASALWSSRAVPDPTPEDALAITPTLGVEGELRARRLAERIEQACRHRCHREARSAVAIQGQLPRIRLDRHTPLREVRDDDV